jgi:hypothetical protein
MFMSTNINNRIVSYTLFTFYFLFTFQMYNVYYFIYIEKKIFFQIFFFAFRVNRPRKKRYRQKKLGSDAAWVS